MVLDLNRSKTVSGRSYGADMDKTESLIVDCGQCVVRSAAACQDCFVTVLLGAPPEEQAFDADEVSAISALAEAGMVPPLRLVTAEDSRFPDERDMTQKNDFSNVV